MAFHQWVFSGRVKSHLIQLDHDLVTKELKIRLNGDIVFNVFPFVDEKRHFSLIIDGQLCVVRVKQEELDFDYDFYEVPGMRKITVSESAEDSRITTWLAAAAMAVILIVSGLAVYNNLIKEPKMGSAVAQILSVSETPGQKSFAYLYLADNRTVIQQVTSADSLFPFHYFYGLRPGQHYQVEYKVRNPEVHALLLNAPTQETLNKLRATALVNLEARAPERFKEGWNDFAACVVDAYYNRLGVKGLTLVNAPRKDLENTEELFYLWQAELDCAKYHLLKPGEKNTEHDELPVTHP